MTLGNWNGYHSYKRREGGGSTSLVKLQYCTEALQLQMGPHSDDWNVQKIPFEIGYWWPFMRRQIHWVWLCINVNFWPRAHKWGTHTAHCIPHEEVTLDTAWVSKNFIVQQSWKTFVKFAAANVSWEDVSFVKRAKIEKKKIKDLKIGLIQFDFVTLCHVLYSFQFNIMYIS